jgi:hypothetical protein
MAVNKASLVQVQAWMGQAHIQTTARYLHHRAQRDDLLAVHDDHAAGVRDREQVATRSDERVDVLPAQAHGAGHAVGDRVDADEPRQVSA